MNPKSPKLKRTRRASRPERNPGNGTACTQVENASLRERLNAQEAETQTLREQCARLQQQIGAGERRVADALMEAEAVARGEALDPKRQDYRRLVHRVRDIVQIALPPDSRVLVVSKGEASIVWLPGCEGLHFPQDNAGQYAGHYLSDHGAVAHLEALRARGADYFLLPATAYWWLEHYPQFRRQMEDRFALVHRDEETCAIFALHQTPEHGSGAVWSRLAAAIAQHGERTGGQASILNWDTGLDLAARFPAENVFAAPQGAKALPYLDASVDMVALFSSSQLRLREARRVAASAVLVFSQGTADGDFTLSVESREVKGAAAKQRAEIILAVLRPQELTPATFETLRREIGAHFDGKLTALVARGAAAVADFESTETDNFAATCNEIAARSRADSLVFLDAALLPLPGCIPALLATLRDFRDAGTVGGKLLHADGCLREIGREPQRDGSLQPIGTGEWGCDDPEWSYVCEVPLPSAGLLATPRALFRELGGFDTSYLDPGYATAEYAWRAHTAGRRNFCQPEALAVELYAPVADPRTSDTCRRSFAEHWHHTRNLQPQMSREKILVCSPRLPEFDRECGSKRVYDLIEMLREEWAVTFFAQKIEPADRRYVRMLQQRGVATYSLAQDSIERLLARSDFEVAILSFWQMAEAVFPALRRHSPKTRVIVDSQDLHFLRAARQQLRRQSLNQPA